MSVFLYLFAFFLFFGLDVVFWQWNKNLIELQIIDVQRVSMKINPTAAIACYLLIFTGLYWFIFREKRSHIYAAMFGGFVNGVFELTNYSLFNKWHLQMVLVDIAWGAFLWGFVTYITLYLSRTF